MTALTDAMGRINETSTKIENIISDIEDIASQTNLLSLNAAISCREPSISWRVSTADCALCSASFLIWSATTANPFPASPAGDRRGE